MFVPVGPIDNTAVLVVVNGLGSMRRQLKAWTNDDHVGLHVAFLDHNEMIYCINLTPTLHSKVVTKKQMAQWKHFTLKSNSTDTFNNMTDILKIWNVFFDKNRYILFEISLKSVTDGPIANASALIQVMAWHRTGGKGITWTIYAPRRNMASLGTPTKNDLVLFCYNLIKHI